MATKTKKRAKRVTKEQKELAKRYRCAYNYDVLGKTLWEKINNFVDNNSDNHTDKRVIGDFIKEVRKLAESNRQIPEELNND
jgi:hypothetical protein